jgi:hypothetical protein
VLGRRTLLLCPSRSAAPPVPTLSCASLLSRLPGRVVQGFLYIPGDVDDAVAKLKRLLFDKAFNAKVGLAAFILHTFPKVEALSAAMFWAARRCPRWHAGPSGSRWPLELLKRLLGTDGGCRTC